jgi:hypothetical protein
MLNGTVTTSLCAILLLACADPPSPTAEPVKSTAPASAQPSAEASATTTAAATATSEPTAEEGVASATASASPSTDPKLAKTGAPSGAPTASAAATATAVASAPDVKGNETKGASFTAYMSGAGTYKAGQSGTVTAVVNAIGDYHVNQEYPYKFTLNAAPAGVSYGETVVRNVNRSEKRASISIPFTPQSAGTHTISGVCSLSVCTSSNCVIEKVPMSVTVKVE